MSRTDISVLVVDDEEGLADLFSTWLGEVYDVDTAYGGQAALELIDPTTDVVLLDRRMPNLSGDDVLAEIRSRELDCQVAMVTAVEPEVDIVEMGFDDYVVKPVERSELLNLVDRLRSIDELGRHASQYHTERSKQSVLDAQHLSSDLESNGDYQTLQNRIEAYGGSISSLAEAAIDATQTELLTADQAETKVELRNWKQKLDALDENDTLVQVAKERVEELEDELNVDGAEAPERFLEAVAEDFIAEGHWLDQPIRRALNLILRERDRDKFIINRQSLSRQAKQGPSKKFAVSKDVRELAKQELERRA